MYVNLRGRLALDGDLRKSEEEVLAIFNTYGAFCRQNSEFSSDHISGNCMGNTRQAGNAVGPPATELHRCCGLQDTIKREGKKMAEKACLL